MIIDTSKFEAKRHIHKYIHDKQNIIIASKKSIIKQADIVDVISSYQIEKRRKEGLNKEFFDKELITQDDDLENGVIRRKVIINTTNIFDSHQDVHINGLWNKSLAEYDDRAHLREHKDGFVNVISDGDDLAAYTADFTFKELGFKYKGDTQALVFDSTIRKERNEFMYTQYLNGWVKQHSVGMHYVTVLPAIDNKDYATEFKTYKKYIDRIGNIKDVEANGFFFAIKEAKALEGSAVRRGSNPVTPTMNANNNEPVKDHSGLNINEPSTDTRRRIIL